NNGASAVSTNFRDFVYSAIWTDILALSQPDCDALYETAINLGDAPEM
ncbi:hypothetical protein RRG08_021529, partial [Elysia crispata]